jgi:hypothetical protein
MAEQLASERGTHALPTRTAIVEPVLGWIKTCSSSAASVYAGDASSATSYTARMMPARLTTFDGCRTATHRSSRFRRGDS